MADPEITSKVMEGIAEGADAGGSASDGGEGGEGGTQGQGTVTGDTPTGEQGGEEGAAQGAPEGGEGGEGDGGDKEPSPAEQRFNEILEKHGFDDAEDLVAALESGKFLREIIGDLDAEQMKADAEEMARTRAFWAQKEAEKRESEETDEETIARLKRENAEMRDRYSRDIEDRDAIAESQRVGKEFDSTMMGLVNSDADLADVQDLALSVLGVNNPAIEVDPADRKAVRQAATQSLNQLKQWKAKIEQNAVDKYVAGKSTITPIKETDGSVSSPSVKQDREPLKPGTTLDDANAATKERLVELLNKESAA